MIPSLVLVLGGARQWLRSQFTWTARCTKLVSVMAMAFAMMCVANQALNVGQAVADLLAACAAVIAAFFAWPARERDTQEWEEGYEAGHFVGRASLPKTVHRIVIVDPPTFHRFLELPADRLMPKEKK